MTRKIVGYTIAFFPLWATILLFLYINYTLTIFIALGIILMVVVCALMGIIVEIGLRIARGQEL